MRRYLALAFSALATISCGAEVPKPAPIRLSDQGGALKRPPNFTVSGLPAVFVDFLSADYSLTFDITTKTSRFHSKIRFSALESGNPVFDLVPETTSI